MTSTNARIQQLTEHSFFNLKEANQLYVLESIITKVATSTYTQDLVLRGGMLSRCWYAPNKWMPSDIDYMVTTPIPIPEMEAIWRDILGATSLEEEITFLIETLHSEVIWAEAKDPGLRLFVAAQIDPQAAPITIHIDISYADPMVPAPSYRAYPSLFFGAIENVQCVHPETSAGWKFYGLFERKKNRWRAKDLFGLYYLLTNHSLNLEQVLLSFNATSIERGTPLQLAARFFEGEFAQGKASQRQWKVFCQEHWAMGLPQDLQEVIAVVQQALRPSYMRLLEQYNQISYVGSKGFPVINTLQEVLLAIQEREEFAVYQRGAYQIVDYKQPIKYSFLPAAQALHPSVAAIYALRRECRGLIFDQEGFLVHRKLHKFFSVGELAETQLQNINWSQPCRVLEKLDGSLVAPMFWEGELRWTTRKGLSSIADQAALFAAQHPAKGYVPMVTELLHNGWTPCFEWCSRQHPIVLDYDKEQLVLTAIRNNYTGHYLAYEAMQALAKKHAIPCVATVRMLHQEEAADFIHYAQQERKGEGYVLRFPDDRFYKVKNDWYLRLHQLVAPTNRERYVWLVFLKGELDPLVAAVAPSLRPAVQIIAAELEAKVQLVLAWLGALLQTALAHPLIAANQDFNLKDKLFALHYANALPPVWQKLAFVAWHRVKSEPDLPFYNLILDFLAPYCQSNRRWKMIQSSLKQLP